MNLKTMQARAKRNHERRGYTSDLPTLGLGLCEEAGEVAKAINLLNPHYKARPGKMFDSLEHEIADLLVYLCAIANVRGIDLDALMEEKLTYKDVGS
jgi:NTP pyrophosphatase (non-canonical NTP hydrolase)